jgi:hypothetical protein
MRCAILLGVLLTAAPTFAADPPLPGENLFPLTIGNVWTYKVSGQDDRFVVRAVRHEMVGEQACVLLEATLKDRVVATEHVAFTKTGLCRFREDKEDVEPPVCVLRWPAPPKGWFTGARKKNEFHVGPRSASAFFTAKSDEIAVLGTKYKTVVVRADVNEGPGRPASFSDTWYAEGIGMVKQEIHEGAKRPALILELEKAEKGTDR